MLLKNVYSSPSAPSSNTTIIPALKWSRAGGCNGMSPPIRCFGAPSRGRFGRRRASIVTNANPPAHHPFLIGGSNFVSETVIAYEAGLSCPAWPEGFRLDLDFLQRLR